MNSIKIFFITLGCAAFFLFFLSGAFGVYGEGPDAVPNNDPNAKGGMINLLTGKDTGTGILGNTLFKNIKKDPRTVAREIIFVVLGFLGTLMICLIIYSGFLWMTAGGEKEKITEAQAHLRNAVIGIILVMSAWTIAMFVLNALKQVVSSTS